MNQQKRFFIELAYKGCAYHGWQRQPNALTVQEVLDKALCTVFRQHTESTGCGRTDTGVHAKQFFAHFDLGISADMNLDKAIISLNGILPPDISIKQIVEVSPQAHARFDAVGRSYEYHIHHYKDPFKLGFSWQLRDELDIEAMNKAAKILTSYRDFSCFSKSNTQVFTNNCTVKKAYWKKYPDGMVFYITADRFLRNMVRAIVGTLIPIGRGEYKPEEIRGIIESKNRSNAGASVPACGLYLTKVTYPPFLTGSIP